MTATAVASVERLRVGEVGDISVKITIADGWHINGTDPGFEFLVPTTVDLDVPAGIHVADVRFPEPVERALKLAGNKTLKLYEGTIAIQARLRYERSAETASDPVVTLRYQACNDTLCLRPASITLQVPLKLAAAGFTYLPTAGVEQTLPFEPFTLEAYERARAARKPFVIEFSADWCLPCKEMEDRTFTDPGVIRAAEGLLFFLVDMTTSDRLEEQLLERFKVVGAPTTVFYGADGKEHMRRIGFIGPRDFADILAELRGGRDVIDPPSVRAIERGV